MLELENINAYYGDSHILHGVSLSVREGEIVCLLGRNGAGKTTCMNVTVGLVPARRGAVEIFGNPVTRLAPEQIAAYGVALVPQGRRVFKSLTVRENLMVAARKPAQGGAAAWSLDTVFRMFPRLAERRSQRAGTMSGGERQMLAVGRALMSEPRLLMLDEPSLGLAPAIVDAMYDSFAALHKDGQTILLAEQSVDLALEAADHAYVLQVGRTVLEGPAKAMADNPDVQRIYLGVE